MLLVVYVTGIHVLYNDTVYDYVDYIQMGHV